MCSVKKVFLEILQNSQKISVLEPLILIDFQACNFFEKRLQCFPEHFAVQSFKCTYFAEGWLLLKYLLKIKIAALDQLLALNGPIPDKVKKLS